MKTKILGKLQDKFSDKENLRNLHRQDFGRKRPSFQCAILTMDRFSFTSFCAIIGHIKIEVYSICPLPVLSSHRVDFLETHSNDPNRI